MAAYVRPKIVSDGDVFRTSKVSLEHEGMEMILPVSSIDVSCDPNEFVKAHLELSIHSCDLTAMLRGGSLARVVAQDTNGRANYSHVTVLRNDELVRARSFRWTFDPTGPARLWLEGEV